MINAGICSVTLRQMSAQDVIAVAVDAGLTHVEWGGDVHVPPGDDGRAERVREMTERAGLTVASYGSYLRLGQAEEGTGRDRRVERTLRAAHLLGAPRLRVWAGSTGSAAASEGLRRQVVDSTRRLADRAAEHGIEVAFEFHAGTLTDSAGSALDLVRRIGHASVGLCWQPPNDLVDAEVLAGLDTVLEHVRAVHVFSWWPGTVRLPLVARAGMWGAALSRLRARGGVLDALLEFVPGDDPAEVRAEADTLRDLARLA